MAAAARVILVALVAACAVERSSSRAQSVCSLDEDGLPVDCGPGPGGGGSGSDWPPPPPPFCQPECDPSIQWLADALCTTWCGRAMHCQSSCVTPDCARGDLVAGWCVE